MKNRFSPDRQRLGQVIGVFSAMLCGMTALAFAGSIWIGHPDERSTALVSLGIAALAGLALFAALSRAPILLMVVFAISFFPVGLYLAINPHWVRLAGLATLGYVLSAWLIGRKGA